MQKATVDYAGEINPGQGPPPDDLYIHQQEAMVALDKISHNKKSSFAGLLVVPTGGGKTMIAIRWLLRHMVDRHKKVLWIAHRHELLEQAFRSIQRNAYSEIIPNRKRFRFRIISGLHDRPVNIQPDDDILIASKHSLYRSLGYLEDWLRVTDEVLLVIDEAHHAPAKTYRKIIDAVKTENGDQRKFRMLGLTATPFRTDRSERGLLGQLFPDDIVYGVDLRTLVARGILSDPEFEPLKTNLDFRQKLNARDIRAIQAFDRLPEDVAQEIAESSQRNKCIVSHYVQNLEKYDQVLVFAINVRNAIVLSKLFNVELNRHFGTRSQVYSEYVVGEVRDASTGVRISTEDNKEKIQRFREGQTRVLVNVNILTEGADLPSVQTVFLTRPTMSKILMTQMIGRALRGEKAGGKKEAYIVSFIDDWQDKISWVNPESVLLESAGIFPKGRKTTERILRWISITKIEEFAAMMHRRIPPVEALDFLQRIPIGVYAFSILLPPTEQGDALEKQCEVLVFEHLEQAYRDFVNDLPVLLADVDLVDQEYLSEEQLECLCKVAIAEYFEGYELWSDFQEHKDTLGFRKQDIKDMLRHYAQKESAPTLYRFEARDECDLTKVAVRILNSGMDVETERKHINSLWDDRESYWPLLFGHNKTYFLRQLSIEREKLLFPDLYRKREGPLVRKDQVDIARLSLPEMRKKAPRYWRRLRDQVFVKHTDADGTITCAISGFKSRHKLHFQIDHIIPMSKGGLSTLENLQVVDRRTNRDKGDKLKAYCVKCGAKRFMITSKRVVLSNGRPALKGYCEECGTAVYRILPK